MARSNRERTEATRQALLDAARTLFVERGYGETSTPDVCAAAGITRGALYHHFADKRDLFRHVMADEAAAVAADIEAAAPAGLDPAEALMAGAQAYLDAMTVPGRTRLLLVEGPAALGLRETLALDEANAARTLREGLDAAGVGGQGEVALRALAPLLSAAFDRAALEIEAGADAARVREAMLWLLRRALGKD
ncbi:TetR/AcrR family transcriptional regulator [Cupriavidus sp. P-10]|uniref:TetR family transcriptional regulator n=1 Tax=Cupriavidus sp. P-10 TaxID=2027911 RepID=UPI000EE0973B|nr:TetR family transcriptional regulator [Cupriavidus sp. P-10]BDB22833.1 TetR/AcrR family transcriptional regulator [Cupriavidus sp. P-10]